MTKGATDLQRRALRRQAQLLSDQLDEWDPIGVYAGDDGGSPHPGEYDCLVWPLLRRLHDGAGVEEIAGFLDRELTDHFGHAAGRGSAFATSLLAWWAQAAPTDGPSS